MAHFPTPFSPLINNYDSFGWIPTIRGSLLISLFDDAKDIWGDCDRFSVEIKTYDRAHPMNKPSRYLVAIALVTIDDRKAGLSLKGWTYNKTFVVGYSFK